MQCKTCGTPLTVQIGAAPPLVPAYVPNSGTPLAYARVPAQSQIMLCAHEVDDQEWVAAVLVHLATHAPVRHRTERLGNGTVRHILVFDQSAESVAAPAVETGA